PIVHVNADDPEAAIAAVRLALAYRRRFGHDVVVDLVGYRRFGHNEQDEPAYTQPLQAARIAEQPTAREQYAAQLVEAGVVTAEGAQAMFDQPLAELKAAHERLKQALAEPPSREPLPPPARPAEIVTAVPADRLRAL